MSAPAPARTRVDPRIRRRRVEVAQARGRRRRRILAAVVAVALVVAVAYGLARSPLLAVGDVVVEGVVQVDAEEVVAASGIESGDPILMADLGAAARRVEELTWVDSARVVRDLPSTVRIEVVERVPASWFAAADGSAALVDGTGHVVALAPDAAGLPELVDVEPAEPGGRVEPVGLAAVVPELPEELRSRVVAVVHVEEGSDPGAVLVLGDGPEIRLGALRQVAEKASAALAVLSGLGDDVVDYVDVRVPSVAVTG